MIELTQSYLSQAPALGWNSFWVSQAFIGIALICDIISYQLKKREHVLIMFSISATLIAIHLWLLEQPTAALIVGLGAVRFITAIFTGSNKVMYLFQALATIVTVIFYTGLLDILAWVCNILFTTASFQKSDKSLRQIMMGGTSLWIIYQFLIFSPAAIVLESIFLSSNLIGYYRFYIRKAKT